MTCGNKSLTIYNFQIKCFRCLLIFFVILASFILISDSFISSNNKYDASTIDAINLTTPQLDQHPFSSLTKYDKYLIADLNQNYCDGVGNMMFRVASFYGIGRDLERKTCFQGRCSDHYHIELYSTFPNLQNLPLSKNCRLPLKPIKVEFAPKGWEYDNTLRLHEYDNETALELHASYLQSHKFFHWIRSEIMHVFEFSDYIKGFVDDYARQMFGENNSTKICAHIRQGDFKDRHPMLESKASFIINSLNYLISKVMLDNNTKNLSVLLLTDDVKFAENVIKQIKNTNLASKTFVDRELSRLENIALAARHCDYFILTSAASTFGWWMAYLIADKKQENIFFNSLFFKKGYENIAKNWRESDYFPPKWKRLVYDAKRDVIFEQNRSIPVVPI